MHQAMRAPPTGAWNRLRWLGPATGLAIATVGGLLTGLGACGGYAWHAPATAVGLLLAMALVCAFPPIVLRRPVFRFAACLAITGWAAAVHLGSAAFYPDDPASLADFVRRLLVAVERGPC